MSSNISLYDKGVKDKDPISTIVFILMAWVMFEWFSIPGSAPFSNTIVSNRFASAVTGSRFILILLLPLGIMMLVTFMVDKMRTEGVEEIGIKGLELQSAIRTSLAREKYNRETRKIADLQAKIRSGEITEEQAYQILLKHSKKSLQDIEVEEE